MTTDARCGTGGIDALVNRMVLNPPGRQCRARFQSLGDSVSQENVTQIMQLYSLGLGINRPKTRL